MKWGLYRDRGGPYGEVLKQQLEQFPGRGGGVEAVARAFGLKA